MVKRLFPPNKKGDQPKASQSPYTRLWCKFTNLIWEMAMTREFSSIAELKSIREQKSRLSERERELSSPVLHDVSLIPEIYGWFKDILSANCCTPCIDSVLQRKKFLFIVLFLFSPSVLAGGRLPKGIRHELSRVFPKLSPCVISNNISDVVFLYQNYKDFRRDIDYLYSGIVCRINESR